MKRKSDTPSNWRLTKSQDYLVPQITDNVSTGSALLMRMLNGRKDAKAWGSVNGPQILVPIKYVASTVGGWYSNWDTFSTNQVNTRVNATFKPKQLYFTVGASGIQVAVNKGPQATLDLLTVEMDSVATDMYETLATGLFSDGTGTSSKQLDGLRTAVLSSGTYAGLAPGTYTTWVSDLDSSSNAITLAEISASFEAAAIGANHPTIGVTTPAIFTTIETLCMGTISFNNPVPGVSRQVGTMTREGVKNGQTGEFGFTALFFRGVPIVSDEKCPSGNFYLLDETKMGLAMWPYPDFPGYVTKPNYNGFCWTGLKIPTNQDATVGLLKKLADLKSSLINLGTSVYTKILVFLKRVWYNGIYDNPQQAKNRISWKKVLCFAVAETEQEERITFSFA